jgi:hypothetical protein
VDAAARIAPDGDVQAAIAMARALTEPVFERADAAALRHQRRHRAIVDVVAFTGTLAVVLGTVTLTQTLEAVAVRFAEAVAAAAAIIAVVLGIWAGSQRRWLLERHKAEQARLCAFRALVRFVGDSGSDAGGWSDRLRADVAGIERRSERELEGWIADETPAETYQAFDENVRSESALRTVVTEYAQAAIEAQRAYFTARARANERWDRRTRSASPILFFISVVSIIPGAILRLRGAQDAASLFISIAVILPAIAGGIRLYRSAHEFARNGIRFRAKAVVLGMLADRLTNASSANALFRDLQFAERLFDAEHREWLALMLDAEWYG